MQVSLCVLVIAAVICTQLWTVVSWFVQFKRMFAVCFLVSIVWNWFYLYKVTATLPTAMQCTHCLFPMAPLMRAMCGPQIEFAKHQSRLVKMDTSYEKCTGMKKIDWTDNLKGIWCRVYIIRMCCVHRYCLFNGSIDFVK